MTQRRKVLTGRSVASGIVIGTTRTVTSGAPAIAELSLPTGKLQAELTALDEAVRHTVAELRSLRDAAGKKIAGPLTKIFDAQLLIAGDVEFLNQVKERILADRKNASFVYQRMVTEAIAPLKDTSDTYLAQMANDIEAVARKVLSHLDGVAEDATVSFAANTIVVSDRFSPNEILSLRSRRAIGFIAGDGGRNSHMALIARSLMLPVVVLPEAFVEIADRTRVVVDGTSGEVILNPTDQECAEYNRKKKKLGPAMVGRIRKLSTVPPLTRDDHPIDIMANLELPGPVDAILSEKRIPVGLYRTEFLCLEQGGFPDEEAQYRIYNEIAETFAGASVTLRTFDLGGDKLPGDTLVMPEENPALGWRGIRPMLDLREVFKTQIRAMLRASAHGRLRILLPMIADKSELERARRMISQVMLGLRRQHEEYRKEIEIGIMIEVPSAALQVEHLLPHCDFVAIGTNDLTQYTMSADRNNALVADLYQYLHPAVLQLVKRVATACQRAGVPCHLCGEAAGDHAALPLFIGMGIDKFSMNPARIFDACRLVGKINREVAASLVPGVLASDSASDVQKRLAEFRKTLSL